MSVRQIFCTLYIKCVMLEKTIVANTRPLVLMVPKVSVEIGQMVS
jgi:hypothetical protein